MMQVGFLVCLLLALVTGQGDQRSGRVEENHSLPGCSAEPWGADFPGGAECPHHLCSPRGRWGGAAAPPAGVKGRCGTCHRSREGVAEVCRAAVEAERLGSERQEGHGGEDQERAVQDPAAQHRSSVGWAAQVPALEGSGELAVGQVVRRECSPSHTHVYMGGRPPAGQPL